MRCHWCVSLVPSVRRAQPRIGSLAALLRLQSKHWRQDLKSCTAHACDLRRETRGEAREDANRSQSARVQHTHTHTRLHTLLTLSLLLARPEVMQTRVSRQRARDARGVWRGTDAARCGVIGRKKRSERRSNMQLEHREVRGGRTLS